MAGTVFGQRDWLDAAVPALKTGKTVMLLSV
jgi:hypothetical protein